ncbi:hypothetical protein MM221_11380 [Salipaludibacillus sp. LMS25]|jgi:hypothetical protein|uniref:DUF6612 family protein n=1 Tax=Salipaludibacillus sp. LMS25 TaxID=2924031 RepID=UPI0020D0E952|nr:DUF6612 family protein [Salipaludibacillus sp. LMS25]UTR13251.1 hypothetical protein MM221_11380 [Salipaludibacillus sp. LMS25]
MKTSFVLVTTGLLLLATGCAESSNNLSQEDVMERVSTNKEDVENYHGEFVLTFELEAGLFSSQASEASFTVDMFETTQDSHGTIYSAADDTEETMEYYKVGEEAYMNTNDEGWENTSDSIDDFTNFDSDYNAMAGILEDIIEETEQTEEEKAYIYTFTGYNKAIYKAFEKPFSVELTGFDLESDTDLDVTITVSKDTFTIESIDYEITADNDLSSIFMTISVDYSDMNQLDPIEIPEKVIKEAN